MAGATLGSTLIAGLLDSGALEIGAGLSSGQGQSPGAMAFEVDGASVVASFSAACTTLDSVIAQRSWFAEQSLRSFLSQYFYVSGCNGPLLYCDSSGVLKLSAVVDESGDVKRQMAEFFDAAIHWRAAARSLCDERAVEAALRSRPQDKIPIGAIV